MSTTVDSLSADALSVARFIFYLRSNVAALKAKCGLRNCPSCLHFSSGFSQVPIERLYTSEETSTRIIRFCHSLRECTMRSHSQEVFKLESRLALHSTLPRLSIPLRERSPFSATVSSLILMRRRTCECKILLPRRTANHG